LTTKTRRRVFIAVIVAALTLPAETVLLRALSAPAPDDAAQTWASALTEPELDAASDKVQDYTFPYRRAIMKALSPEKRSRVWRTHIARYMKKFPDLDAGAVAALESAIAVASPESFSNPTDATRASVAAVAAEVEARLGKDAARYLLYHLGPTSGTVPAPVSLTDRLAGLVRQSFVALAVIEDCDCNYDWDGCSMANYCSISTACRTDEEWPACGWLWQSICDGLCKAGLPGAGG
jgi:hypothetical protein